MRTPGMRISNRYNAVGYMPERVVADRDRTIDFRPMTIEAIPMLRNFMAYNPSRTCDYTLGGMCMWIDYFSYEYAVVEDTLFVKGISENHPDMVAFSLPLGEMALDRAVGLVVEYCRMNGLRPAFSAIPADKVDVVAAACGGAVERLDGWSDYLYDASALAELTGKAYSKKRNHVNRFLLENQDARLEMLTSENIAEAKRFLDRVDLSGKTDPGMASYELQQCHEVLDNLDLYLFEGAVLRSQGGRICALTLGEVINDTLYVHIEKMDHQVNGAGETVNKLFAAEMLERNDGLRYINREEDMNDPGLRFAKESYHPCCLLDKYNVIA